MMMNRQTSMPVAGTSGDQGSLPADVFTSAKSSSFLRRFWKASTFRTRLSATELESTLRELDTKVGNEESGSSIKEDANAGRARVELNGGDVYRGPWINHQPVGFGRYSWANGNEYIGGFQDGAPCGHGTFEWAHGGVYEGEFQDGLMHGSGVYTSPSGAEYRGSWRRGKKHGLGLQLYANGDSYEGLWNNGTPHGPGTYRWNIQNEELDLEEFNGEWVNGRMHGWGTLRWSSGDRYDGNWLHGAISGDGVMTWRDACSFSGQWKDGKRHGLGAFRKASTHINDGNPRNTLAYTFGMRRHGKSKSFDESEGEDVSLADIGDTYVLLCKCDEDQITQKEIVEADRVAHKQSGWSRPMASRSTKVRKVRHGETIYKGHGSYDLMLQLRVGIRWSVSVMQHSANTELRPISFETTVKQFFPRNGSAKTPPHFARTFKWKEYRPEVFQKLRDRWGVQPAEFMLSLCGDQALRELSSPGKSGSVFYISHDDKFLLKTMRKAEMENLKLWLHSYYKHVHDNPETLLPKFFGLYSIKAIGSARKVRVIVMANLFASNHVIHRTFDLKGSMHGRFTKADNMKPNPVYKDLDLSSIFRLEEGKSEKLIAQLQTDCAFLQRLRVMDYSLLVGVHILPPTLADKAKQLASSPTSPADSHSPWGGVEWRDQAIDSVRRNVKAMDLYTNRKEFGFSSGVETSAKSLATLRPPPGTDDLLALSTSGSKGELGVAMSAVAVHGRVLATEAPRPCALEEQTEPQDVILYLGIIDVLQVYSTSKNLETKMMGAMGKKSFSSVDPISYAKRFMKFMSKLFE